MTMGLRFSLREEQLGPLLSEETTTVRRPPPFHPRGCSAILCTMARTCAREDRDTLRGVQECRALCGLCVAWDSLTCQGFLVGAICMGLTHHP